jgi:hypothetical protein
LATFVHGIAFVHVSLSVPIGSTYATWLASPHDPSGRHTSEPGHSACAWHPRHAWSSPHTGVVPAHALVWSGAMHCTHVFVPDTSHTAVGAVHSAFDVQPIGPPPSGAGQFSVSSGCAGQYCELFSLQAASKIIEQAANRSQDDMSSST